MTTYIALLRGINVGGKRKILMSDLKQLFAKLNFTNVQTYIQSGNVIFTSLKKQTSIELSLLIHDAILNQFGFEVPVVVKTIGELEQVALNNPFLEDPAIEIKDCHVTFLQHLPSKEAVEAIQKMDQPTDSFTIYNSNIYLHCTDSYHKSKFTNTFFEKKLAVPATTRNWKTVLKLYEMCKI
ncbi:DUF1697 domain-containing protein [Aquimarina sp. 2-A2]|uniref:DUF1697 domain-containing protein n=1 Tax=Aquimarina sp. 2-A2 TaxID=3382644 RepID=UPI00387F1B7A